MTTNRQHVSALLRALRRTLDVPQTEVATELEMSGMQLGHIEAGRRPATPEFLRAYAEYLLPGNGEAFATAVLSEEPTAIQRIAQLVPEPEREEFLRTYAKLVTREAPQRTHLTAEQIVALPIANLAAITQLATQAGLDPREIHARRQFAFGTTPLPDTSSPTPTAESPARLTSQRTVRPSTPSPSSGRHRSLEIYALERLRAHLSTVGVQLVVCEGTVDLGSGVSLQLDLLDVTNHFALEVRSLRHRDSTAVVDCIGKATIAQRGGFRYVVLCPRTPDERTVELLRSFDVPVVWFDDQSRELAGAPLW